MALVWAAGILWFAFEVASPGDSGGTPEANATDATGEPISATDEAALKEALNGF